MDECASYPPRRCQVVVVEDDESVLGALRFVFELEGYRVHACRDGESLLAALPRESDTCFVLDERLPGLSGLDVVASIRAAGVDAPAILVTSHPSMNLRARAAAAGVPIVEKPLLGDALSRKVREALSA